MKKMRIAALAAALIVCCTIFLFVGVNASDMPFTNLFKEGFAGYTSDEGQFLAHDMVSSQPISVSAGESIWFGPCEKGQYFHLVGLDGSGNAATDKVRGKELTVFDTFGNDTVIYQYTVPAGVSKLVFSVPGSLKNVYTVANSEVSALTWIAYWSQQGVNTDDYVGQNSYYEVAEGDKLYFGAITKGGAASSVIYDKGGNPVGTIAESDLRLVESFGGEYGIYCYTVPAGVAYAEVNYDASRQEYYSYLQVAAGESVTDESVVSSFIDEWGIPRPLDSTVAALSGKSALFLGDSITFGARDRANIYGVPGTNPGAGGWAARIAYFAGMNVTNNGVSGACISTAREQSNSAKHYIYNNLVSVETEKYDYIIMHGLFNDASEKVALGETQGMANFDPAKADVTTYAGGLENLFYTAKTQHPEAILGYIVNFHTERNVDQTPYVAMAIAICEDWGIPYLDLYNLGGFAVEFDDGLHPSSAGYDSMYTTVANWMATLTGNTAGSGAAKAKVMSYNVFWGADVPTDKGITIENRYQKVADKIVAENADIVLLQEYTDAFDKIFKQTATGYTVYGDAHSSDERAPVAWKTSKYDLVDSGSFTAPGNWCSSTTKYPRVINWVLLKDKTTGNELLAMSVHGQPNSENEEARNKTMALVAEQVTKLSTEHGNVPVIVGGDFNMAVGSAAYSNLTSGGLMDVRATVNPGSIGSYSDWDRETGKFAMGDYLFMSKNINAQSYTVITDDIDSGRTDGKTVHISDHCPIVTVISY